MHILKTIRLFIWLGALAAIIWVGLSPYFPALWSAATQGQFGRVDWGLLTKLAISQIAARTWAVAILCAAPLSNILLIIFTRYALRRQRAAHALAERNCTTYQVTLGREDMVPIPQMRDFWFWARGGLGGWGFSGWLRRITGGSPYMAWCDLSQFDQRYQSAVYIRVVGSPQVRHAMESELHIHPSIQTAVVEYPTVNMNTDNTRHIWLRLAYDSAHQIRTDFDELVDARSVLHKMLCTTARVPRIEVCYRMRPAGKEWSGRVKRQARRNRAASSIGEWRGEQERSAVPRPGVVSHTLNTNWRTKADSDAYGWSAEISITATGEIAEVEKVLRSIALHYFAAFTAANRFIVASIHPGPAPLGYPAMLEDRTILSPAECAAMLHYSKAANVQGLAYANAKYLVADGDLRMGEVPFIREPNGRIATDKQGYQQMNWRPPQQATLPPREAVWRKSALGYNGDHIIGIERNDRMKGTLVIGPPGVGKSSLLVGIALGDIASGDGLAVIEPHRDLVEDIMMRLDRRDWGRVVYLDPQELLAVGRAITINIMEGAVGVEQRNLIQNQTVQIIRAMFGTNWEAATRMQSLLHNALGTILEQEPNATLRNIARFMGNHPYNQWYRDSLKATTRNSDYRHYWDDYFDPTDDRDKAQMISPVYTRVTKALQDPYSRAIVSSAYSSVDIGDVMEDGGILLVNLPGAGKNAGNETMSAIASLILSKIQVESQRRQVAVKKNDRRPFYLIVDEAQLFINETVEDMVAQLRKFRRGLILAFQTPSQLDPDTRNVLSAAMQNKIIFRAEGADTEIASETMLNNEVLPAEVNTLPNRSAYARLLGNETPRPVCTLQTLSLPAPQSWPYPAADLQTGREEMRRAHPAPTSQVIPALDLIAATLDKVREAHLHPTDSVMQTESEAQEEQAIRILTGLSDDNFKLVRAVQRRRDQWLADWLLQNPGAMGSQVELIKEVSWLRHSVPQALVSAEARREDARFTAQARLATMTARPGNGGGRGERPEDSDNPLQPAPLPNPDAENSQTAPVGAASPMRPSSPTTRSPGAASGLPATPPGRRQGN